MRIILLAIFYGPEFNKEKTTARDKAKIELLEKYGGEEHLAVPPKELLLGQTENYVEYSRKGKIVKGGESPKIKSRYEEDVYPLNHTSVFGSYWTDGQWGYKCCHSLMKNLYCIRIDGLKTFENIVKADSRPKRRLYIYYYYHCYTESSIVVLVELSTSMSDVNGQSDSEDEMKEKEVRERDSKRREKRQRRKQGLGVKRRMKGMLFLSVFFCQFYDFFQISNTCYLLSFLY
uniref:Pre-mRNA-splicing factor SLU7 n=1 Tax=Heterorhabditis bacteriophora TaxID=37862 RepID=A0A1I7WLI5_HETBA